MTFPLWFGSSMRGTYLTSLYQPNAFIYAWGSFLADSSDSEDFHILLHANSVDRLVIPPTTWHIC